MTSDVEPPARSEVPTPDPHPPVMFESAPSQKNPYVSLGVVGFALSFIGFLNIAGLIISIVALVKSTRRGFTNGFALAGIIIAGIGILFVALCLALIVPAAVDAVQNCARLGTGIHHVNGATYTCSPTSSYVSRGF